VRDGHHGLAFHQTIETFLDGDFDFAVERTRGFVEQEDGSILEHDACDSDALALTAAEFDAPFAHMCMVACTARGIAQGHDEIVRLGALRCRHHVGVAGIRPAVTDIVADRPVQQRGVLSHHADLSPEAVLSGESDILSVDENSTPGQIVETQQ